MALWPVAHPGTGTVSLLCPKLVLWVSVNCHRAYSSLQNGRVLPQICRHLCFSRHLVHAVNDVYRRCNAANHQATCTGPQQPVVTPEISRSTESSRLWTGLRSIFSPPLTHLQQQPLPTRRTTSLQPLSATHHAKRLKPHVPHTCQLGMTQMLRAPVNRA